MVFFVLFLVFVLALWRVRSKNCGCPYCWLETVLMTYLHFLFCCHRAASMPREQHAPEVERAFPTRSWILKWGPLYPLATRCVMFDNDLFIRLEENTVLFTFLHLKLNCLHKDWNFLKDLEKWFSSSWALFHPTSSKWSLLRVELVGLCVNLPLLFWLIRSECLCVSLFVYLSCLSVCFLQEHLVLFSLILRCIDNYNGVLD